MIFQIGGYPPGGVGGPSVKGRATGIPVVLCPIISVGVDVRDTSSDSYLLQWGIRHESKL